MKKQFKGFGEIPEGRKEYLENLRNRIVKDFYPDGEPPNVRLKVWRDEETQDLGIADVTNRPEFWNLPNYIDSQDQKTPLFKWMMKSINQDNSKRYINN